MANVYLECIGFFISLTVLIRSVKSYEVPPALVEPLSPVGFRVSVPDYAGITLFAFHGNVNKDFENGLEAGDVAVDVLRKKNGRWTYVNRSVKLKIGDTLYYWLYVIKDGLGYQRLFQSYKVENLIPDGEDKTGGSAPPAPPPPPPKEDCKNTPTKMNGISQRCSGSLIFDSRYDSGINEKWTHVVQLGENEGEFTVFDNDQTNAHAESSNLVIKPILLDNKYGKEFTAYETLDLGNRCTSSTPLDCKRSASGSVFLPPIQSARLTTEYSFSFRYGVIEVRAKLPQGDWVVPEIWLQPKPSRSGKKEPGKINLVKYYGNDDLTIEGTDRGNDVFFSEIENGGETKKYRYKSGSKDALYSQYHNFKIIWEPDQIRFYFDNNEIGNWNSQTESESFQEIKRMMADKEFFITMGLHVGGIKDFPDNCQNRGNPKPWKNNQVARRKNFYDDSRNWLSTWNDKTALRIEHVKVWTL